MTERENKLEDLLTGVVADAKSVRHVLDDMLLNDLDDVEERIYMGQVFADRIVATAREATDILIKK